MLAERRIAGKNHAFENYDGLSVAKWALHTCVIYFLSQSFLAVTHFVVLCSGYHFAKGIQWNCKGVDDLRFAHPNAVQLSDIFFSKSTDAKLVYKLVGTLVTCCWPLSTAFSFSLILFCLPDMCACAVFGENQIKHKPSIPEALFY